MVVFSVVVVVVVVVVRFQMCSLAFSLSLSLSKRALLIKEILKDAAGTLDASLKKTKTLNIYVTLNRNTVMVRDV